MGHRGLARVIIPTLLFNELVQLHNTVAPNLACSEILTCSVSCLSWDFSRACACVCMSQKSNIKTSNIKHQNQPEMQTEIAH